MHYFGPWADPVGAGAKYKSQKDALHAGLQPSAADGATQLRGILNTFLHAKQLKLASNELKARSWAEYHAKSTRLGDAFCVDRNISDLKPADFIAYRVSIAKVWGLVRLGNEVQRVRTIFKYANDVDKLDRPMKFGPDLKKPSRKTMRLNRASRGPRPRHVGGFSVLARD